MGKKITSSARKQKQPESKTPSSEARFRILSDAAPIGIFEFDALGQCIYNNASLAQLTGHPAEKNLGDGWKERIHPQDRAAVGSDWELALAEGRTWDNRHRLLRPDGTIRWVHVRAVPNPNAQGAPNGFIGTVEDITERRLAEAKILENEARYRKMLMLSPDAQYVHVDQRVVFANPAFCQLLGAETAAQLMGKSVYDIVHPDYHTLVRERIAVAVRDRHPAPPIEEKFVRLDGSLVEVEVAANAFDFEGRTEVHVIARDISARKAGEFALRQSEERFKLVARAVSDVIWDWDIVTNTLWWSDGFLTTFGFAAHEIEPGIESWSQRIHPDDLTATLASFHQAIDSGKESWAADYRFRRKDGTYAFIHDRGYISRDTSGRSLRMVGGMADLTERKRLESQYLRAQRMESIGTLAGGIAHDLNNMLAPILMSIELLKLEVTSEPQVKILDTIYTSARRGADLVRQVLSFARGLDGQHVPLNLRHLIDDLEGMISQTFPRNIHIVNEAAKNLWPVSGEATRLSQVLLNLAVNARDAMPHGGTLTLGAANVTLDAQYARTHRRGKAGAYVVLDVTDTGTGIAAEIRDRIFEPFFTTKPVGQGSGLGLATVHAVVESHGGFVVVTSEFHQGTTFKVYLPADPTLLTSPHTPSEQELPRGRGELILVVDDEPSLRQITRQTLETFGYQVVTACDGAEAVTLYTRHIAAAPLVVTDMMMPVMDGPATVRVILQLNPAAKIIGTSGLNAKEIMAKAAQAGVKHFLAKPYPAETLLTLVREVLDTRSET